MALKGVMTNDRNQHDVTQEWSRLSDAREEVRHDEGIDAVGRARAMICG